MREVGRSLGTGRRNGGVVIHRLTGMSGVVTPDHWYKGGGSGDGQY